MKSVLQILLALFAVSLGLAEGPQEPVVKIGLILPLTGAHSATAEAMRQAAELARESQPSVIREKLALVFEDDELSGSRAVSAFMKLRVNDHVAAALVFGGQSVASVAPLAGMNKIPTFALTADSTLVRGKPYMFQHWLSSKEQSSALFQVIKPGSLKRAAFFSTTHNAAIDVLDCFEADAKAKGIESIYRDSFNPGDSDFRSAIARIRSLAPDAIFTVLVSPQMGQFARQLRSAGLRQQLYSSANAEISDEIRSSNGAMEGVVYAGPDLDPAFVKAFVEKTGKYPEFAAPHIYDSVRLIAASIAEGARTSEEIDRYLRQRTTVTGVMGNYSLMDGFRYAVTAVPKQIVNDNFKLLRRP